MFGLNCMSRNVFCFYSFRTLRRLKENLETEKLIMKDVEGWDATQSVYNTDRWVAPREFELEKL